MRAAIAARKNRWSPTGASHFLQHAPRVHVFDKPSKAVVTELRTGARLFMLAQATIDLTAVDIACDGFMTPANFIQTSGPTMLFLSDIYAQFKAAVSAQAGADARTVSNCFLTAIRVRGRQLRDASTRTRMRARNEFAIWCQKRGLEAVRYLATASDGNDVEMRL